MHHLNHGVYALMVGVFERVLFQRGSTNSTQGAGKVHRRGMHTTVGLKLNPHYIYNHLPQPARLPCSLVALVLEQTREMCNMFVQTQLP